MAVPGEGRIDPDPAFLPVAVRDRAEVGLGAFPWERGVRFRSSTEIIGPQAGRLVAVPNHRRR